MQHHLYVRHMDPYGQLHQEGCYAIYNEDTLLALHCKHFLYAKRADIILMSITNALNAASEMGIKEITMHVPPGQAYDTLREGGEFADPQYVNYLGEIYDAMKKFHRVDLVEISTRELTKKCNKNLLRNHLQITEK